MPSNSPQTVFVGGNRLGKGVILRLRNQHHGLRLTRNGIAQAAAVDRCEQPRRRGIEEAESSLLALARWQTI